MRVFINAVLIHTFLNVYVFWRGWKIIPPAYAYRIPFAAVFLTELAVYLFGFILVDEIPIDMLHPIMQIGTSWMVFIMYMTILLFGYDAARFLSGYIKRFPRRRLNLHSLKIKQIYYMASILITVIAMAYGSYRFWHPVVTEITIPVDKKTGINDLRIVMVGDVHAGYLIDRKILKMYVDKIMEQNPDIILLAGDIIDYDILSLDAQNMHEEFQRLKAPYGVYASTGNHEYRLDAEAKIEWLGDKAGLTVLRDSTVNVKNLFYIVGREDDKAPVRKDIDELMKQVDHNLPVIVMNHEPRRLREEADAKADMAFYGHTHNGQLFPYNIVINFIYEVGHGYKKKDNTHVYVTSGLGLSGPQYRIGTISEIVVVNAKFQ